MDTILKADGVTKRYELGKENYVDALRGATVEIKTGEMVAIMGPSGSGKSTLLHILGCLDNADAGEVWLNGRRVDGLNSGAVAKVRRREVGFIFQGFNLVPSLSALDNVALAAEYAGKTRREALHLARRALDDVDLADRAGHRPTELSGGQQQRVAIARALINEPGVIMGDEPTGNLDTTNSVDVMRMMREINLATGTTFVLVTHDPDVAAGCDRIIHMRDGVVVRDEARVLPLVTRGNRRGVREAETELELVS
jgi:putative ABC transport system ATP-binding protein